jgi:uncharacterized membrane protein YecN with MAPEG domain
MAMSPRLHAMSHRPASETFFCWMLGQVLTLADVVHMDSIGWTRRAATSVDLTLLPFFEDSDLPP